MAETRQTRQYKKANLPHSADTISPIYTHPPTHPQEKKKKKKKK